MQERLEKEADPIEVTSNDQVGDGVGSIRHLVGRVGIPALLIINAVKATVVAAGAYSIYPGEVRERAFAAGVATAVELVTSPTLIAVGILVLAKRRKKERDVIPIFPAP